MNLAGKSILTLLLASTATAQEHPLTVFEGLPKRKQKQVLTQIERQLKKCEDPVVQQLLDRIAKAKIRKVAPEEMPSDNKSPKSTFFLAGDRAHDELLEMHPEPPFLPEMHKLASYDWFSGEAVRPRDKLTYVQQFENYLAGYPKGSDFLLAKTLEALDTSKEMRPLAVWFGHRYVQLDGEHYEGVDQYQVHFSGNTMDIADNEAIRFAKTVLGDDSYQAPLTDMHRRGLLHEQVGQGGLRYRRYRILREILAALQLQENPTVTPPYAPLIWRLHFLYEQAGEDTEKLVELLEGKDRDQLVAWIDAEAKQHDGGVEAAADRRSEKIKAQREVIRGIALDVLREFASE